MKYRHIIIAEIGVMKYLERLLAYNDRYYTTKQNKEVFCPISLKIASDILTKLMISPKPLSFESPRAADFTLESLFDEPVSSKPKETG